MPIDTIETNYRVPVWCPVHYGADTLDDACRLPLKDEEVVGQEDYETAVGTCVT